LGWLAATRDNKSKRSGRKKDWKWAASDIFQGPPLLLLRQAGFLSTACDFRYFQ
jgi:hypothetical protein